MPTIDPNKETKTHNHFVHVLGGLYQEWQINFSYGQQYVRSMTTMIVIGPVKVMS